MANLVADTHALVWHLVDPSRLGKGARRAFVGADQGRHLCYVPAVCLIEVALLRERGRLRIGVAQVLEALSGHPGYTVLALDIEQCLEFAALVGIRDPMDRLVAAAARASGSRLVSADPVFDAHGLDRLWD